ncbi:MAG: DUF4093 domain-containing protein [Oscillospiraceae bacterium]|nr:DUF4093 domain-containing protein [Oscillospiraceae bacterium]
MIHVNEVIIVEGRYDKNTLSQIIDGTIIETEGFGIFSNKEKLLLFRRLAETRGLVVLTDSDGAGFVIRNYLKGAIDPKYVKHAYIPEVLGKEKRKSSPSKEGKLGVEGMSREVIISALTRAGVAIDNAPNESQSETITKTDLFELGLSGGKGSSEKRQALLKKLLLPSKLSPNAMLDVLNALMTRDEFVKMFENEIG